MEKSNRHIILFCRKANLRFLVAVTAILLLQIGGVQAQRDEFGVGIGGMNYAGDLARGYNVLNVRPGGQIYYKYNLSNIIGFRFGITGGMISGTDQYPIDAFAEERNGSFQTGIIELSALLEYNFLNIRDEKSNIKWTPYIFFGIGGFAMIGNVDTKGRSLAQPVLPFGLGAKHAFSKRLTFNFEFGIRKMFFDYLDGYSDGDITNKNYQYGNKYDDDWYNYLGFSVSYLLYEIPCPFNFY